MQIARSVIRQFRTVLRRTLSLRGPKNRYPPILFQAGPDGLDLRVQHENRALTYHIAGPCDRELFAIPVGALDEVEGRGQDLVALSLEGSSTVAAHWYDGGVPRVASYEAVAVESLPSPPVVLPT